ncbi:MAG: formate--tetrahydrofolate ligase, partial [Prevotella sp.]|nr:formate--tetrahydrofolate ligase [Prevotella sp.]
NKHIIDAEKEIQLIKDHCEAKSVGFAVNESFAKGGDGAIESAKKVIELIEERNANPLNYTYDLEDDIETKISKVVKKIYGAASVKFEDKANKKLAQIRRMGLDHYPICIAKTQYSFSDDAHQYGTPKDFEFTINDMVINNGAEFIVVIAGSIMRMPGLPAEPQAKHIDIVNGLIEGLS